MVGSTGSDEEVLSDEEVSILGELLLGWFSQIMAAVGDFLGEGIDVAPQTVGLISRSELEQLPFSWREPVVRIPVEWGFADAAAAIVELWFPVDLVECLVQSSAVALRSGRELPGPPEGRRSGAEQPVKVFPFELEEFTSQETQAVEEEVDLLADVSLEIVAEVGRAQKRIGEILEWEEGAVIVLDKLAGESVEVLINGHVIARGEVMVVDDRLAVRVIEISSLEERLGGIL